MCYHTAQTKVTKYLERRFGVKRESTNFDIGETDFTFYHSSGFDHRDLLIIPQEASLILHPALWGLMPEDELGAQHKAYYKNAIRWGAGLNAKSEKMFSHYQYRASSLTRRCIIPFDKFYESYTAPDGKKYPYLIQRKDQDSIGFAGIYSITQDNYVTAAILTKKASPFLEQIHNIKKRQPVLLPKNLEKEWLNNDLSQTHIYDLLHVSYDDTTLEAYTISKDIYRAVDSNHQNILSQTHYTNINPKIVLPS